MNSDENIKLDFDRLACKLGKTRIPAFDEKKKREMKSRIFEQIKLYEEETRGLGSVMAYIRDLSESIHINLLKKAFVKEKVFVKIETTAQKRFFFSDFFVFTRKLVSAALLIFMSLGMFTFMRMTPGVVRAESFSKINFFVGEVFVERNGKSLPAFKGMRILEQDTLITGDNGQVSLVFFDDSVCRISSDSALVVNKLTKDEKNPILSYVELSLLKGALWSNVLNLVGREASFVVKANDVSTKAKKASFNVQVSEGKVEVGVFNNAVEVQMSWDDTKQIVNGEKAVVRRDNVSIHEIADNEKKVAWVAGNIEGDKEYLLNADKRLLGVRMESLGMSGSSKLVMGNTLRENLDLFLTFDDVEKNKKLLDSAESDFVKAQGVLLSGEELTSEQKAEVDEAVNDFADEVAQFYSMVKQVEVTDKEYAKELLAYVEGKVKVYRKDLSGVLPSSPLYGLKGKISDLELLFADNEAEVLAIKENNAEEKLAQVNDVISIGDYEKAGELAQEYKKEVSGVIDSIGEAEVSDSLVKEDLVKGIENNLDVYSSLDVVSTTDVKTISKKVEEVKEGIESGEGEEAKNIAEENVGGSGTEEIDASTEESEEVVNEEKEPTASPSVLEEKYGIRIEGDKPISPLLDF